MKYTYRFVTGEAVGIEVSPELEALLKNEDRLEYNNEQANTRRHISMEMAQADEGMQFVDPDSLPAPGSITRLQAAVALLPEEQRRLIHAVYIEGFSVNAFAAQEGVTGSAISHRLRTAEKHLKEILRDPQF
jgi:DNA-directed RNA polymerase specialized sigma24 family protein